MADCWDLRVYKRLKTYVQWIVYFKKEFFFCLALVQDKKISSLKIGTGLSQKWENEINWVFAQIALEMYFMKYWHLSTVKNKIMDNLTMKIYLNFKDVGST
jgi:hypothetical protein